MTDKKSYITQVNIVQAFCCLFSDKLNGWYRLSLFLITTLWFCLKYRWIKHAKTKTSTFLNFYQRKKNTRKKVIKTEMIFYLLLNRCICFTILKWGTLLLLYYYLLGLNGVQQKYIIGLKFVINNLHGSTLKH